MKITTGRNPVPWNWVVIILFPWFASMMREQISNSGMTFTLKRFIDSPASIGLILSTNQLFSLTVGASVAFISDYIWTRHGRRRPFIVIGFFGGAVLSLFIPVTDSAFLVIFMIIMYQFIVDFATPYQALTMEVIPPEQRGRAEAITHWFKAIAFAVTFSLLIGMFDRVHGFGSFQINGEITMYWINALFLGISGLILIFFVREEKPANFVARKFDYRFAIEFARELSRPNMLWLMGLALVMQTLWLGANQFEPLLVTEQWGYSKEQFGHMMSASTVTTLLMVPVAGWLSDKIDRRRLLWFGLFLLIIARIIFYIAVEFVYQPTPPIAAVFALGFIKLSLGSFMAVACTPLIFDYVSRNRMGTLGCAMSLVFALSMFISTNVMGVWIEYGSKYLYKLPQGTYNYMLAYHWLIFVSLAGIVYFFFFRRAEQSGKLIRLTHPEEKHDAS